MVRAHSADALLPPQVTMQVHDIADNLAEAQLLLLRAGLNRLATWQEARFQHCSLFMVQASRQAI